MHINTIQYVEEEFILLSSRETSTILMLTDIYGSSQVEYMIGEESFWTGTGYEDLLLEKDESTGSFSNTGGQHSITYVEDDFLNEGEYYIYLFNNNFGTSNSNPSYDWERIDGIETSMKEGEISYYYKELIHWYNHLRFLILLMSAARRNMMEILLSIQVCRESSVSMTVMGIWFKNFR